MSSKATKSTINVQYSSNLLYYEQNRSVTYIMQQNITDLNENQEEDIWEAE
jgi:hypothetical protein